eukprot:TRINITY_DN4815_c0_g1_i1.p1 TRINITY_DN4815_c0_g1~~TRINITY_DN4815_c0_g1_i1.p1  ORF type:complete len:503 (-),score=39.27 TRINITY_DN4815_c0_g1_i1:28-1485(-)
MVSGIANFIFVACVCCAANIVLGERITDSMPAPGNVEMHSFQIIDGRPFEYEVRDVIDDADSMIVGDAEADGSASAIPQPRSLLGYEADSGNSEDTLDFVSKPSPSATRPARSVVRLGPQGKFESLQNLSVTPIQRTQTHQGEAGLTQQNSEVQVLPDHEDRDHENREFPRGHFIEPISHRADETRFRRNGDHHEAVEFREEIGNSARDHRTWPQFREHGQSRDEHRNFARDVEEHTSTHPQRTVVDTYEEHEQTDGHPWAASYQGRHESSYDDSELSNDQLLFRNANDVYPTDEMEVDHIVSREAAPHAVHRTERVVAVPFDEHRETVHEVGHHVSSHEDVGAFQGHREGTQEHREFSERMRESPLEEMGTDYGHHESSRGHEFSPGNHEPSRTERYEGHDEFSHWQRESPHEDVAAYNGRRENLRGDHELHQGNSEHLFADTERYEGRHEFSQDEHDSFDDGLAAHQPHQTWQFSIGESRERA